MNKINTFLAEHGIKMVLVLLVLTYLKSCSVGSEVEKIKKEFKAQKEVVDALPNRSDLSIEGLKSEKRMIQATNRKMLDVQRENEIDIELKKLEK